MRSLRVVLLMLAAALPAAGQDAADVGPEYVVKPGESCRSISRKLFPGAKDALDRFHAVNDLGPTPHHLKPGQIVKTGQPSTPDAKLSFVKPEVDTRKRGTPEFSPASRGDPLFRLDAVNTQKGAAAQITFRDESAMQLDEGALVVIYGGGSQAGQQGPARSGEIELVQGEVALSLADLRGDKPAWMASGGGKEGSGGMVVRTPSARIASKARAARIGVDPQKMSRLSVYSGSAQMSGGGAEVKVPQGFGTRVAEGKKPEKPRPLPPAPSWIGPGQIVKVALATGAARVPLRWAKVDAAARYRVQLARDEAFNDRLFDATIDAPAPGAEAADVPVGHYFARVSSIDAAGLVGMPSSARAVQVASAKAERGGPNCSAPGEVRLTLEDSPELQTSIDGAPGSSTIVLRGIGKHELRVFAKGETEGDTLSCEVLAPDVGLKLQREPGGALALLTLDPEIPRDALGLRGLEGANATALEATGKPGEYRAHLTGAAQGDTPGERRGYGAQVTWSDQPIGQAFLDPLPPPPPAPPPPARQAPIGDVLGQPTALVSSPALFAPWIDSRTQVGARLLGEAHARNRSAGWLAAADARLADDGIAAGLAVVGRHLGDGLFSTGDVTAFARFALFDRPAFGLTLGLDATLPGEPGSVSSSPARFRFALSGGTQLGALALFTTQGISASTRAPGWESAYGASLRLTREFSLGAQVNGFVSGGSDSPIGAAFAAALGAVYQLPRVELSASFRAGFTPDGQATYGSATFLIGAAFAIFK